MDWRSEILEVRRGNAETVRLYSKLAPLYEIYARLTITRARRRVLELAAVRDGETVLEIPAGTGVQLVALARRNPSGRTVGVEPAEGMLAQTRMRVDAGGLSRVELHRGSALAIPLEDESLVGENRLPEGLATPWGAQSFSHRVSTVPPLGGVRLAR